jgi:hypothetical protein
VWRLMPGWNIYRNWYLGEGAFVQKSPDVRKWVMSYVNETDPAVAMGNLYSATERLLRASLKTEGVQDEDVLTDTLPNLLKFCTSAKQKFLNLTTMCCDPRAIFWLNSHRIGVEHGDYRRDLRELAKTGWTAQEPEKEYLKIITDRLIGPHWQLCQLFGRIAPETGLFTKEWQPREFKDCEHKRHDPNGRLPDETPQSLAAIRSVALRLAAAGRGCRYGRRPHHFTHCQPDDHGPLL